MEAPSGLSPSSLDLWEQCPRRFREEKIMRRDGGTSVDAVLGTYVHEVLEHLMQLPPKLRTPASARSLARKIWPGYREGEETAPVVAPDEAGELAFRRRAWGSIRSYFNTETAGEVDVLATEQKLEAVIKGVPVRGIVDRLDRDVFGDIVVTDYKTGKVPAKHFRAKKFRQLNIYGLLVEATSDTTPTEGRLVFTSFGEVITTTITDFTLDAALQDLQDGWAGIASAVADDDFPPNPGPLCGWCPFAAECPEGIAELKSRAAKGKLRVDAPAYYLTETVDIPA